MFSRNKGKTSSGRSKGKVSKAKSYTSSGPSTEQQHEDYENAVDSESDSPPASSFLFAVSGITLNEDPRSNGVLPRVDDFGRWVPPIYAAGFGPQNSGTTFRWKSGDISLAAGYGSNAPLETYKATTMFWCNPFHHFIVAAGDATTRNIADTVPEDTWYALNFHHDGALSRVDYVGDQYLAGNERQFITHLGLQVYENPEDDAPKSSGLAGNLAILIGLVAFSCKRRDLDQVLVRDQTWHAYRWHGHNRPHGRKEARGMVISVYLDPDNREGSTEAILDDLEDGEYLLK